MANRRMFSLDVVDTDNFLDMPLSAQGLYFHLGMRADDDGFISSPKKIIKIVNASEDDLKLLIIKGYLIPFESGVIVIKHWRQNNYVKGDRYKPTIYQNERKQLYAENNIYHLDTVCIQNGTKTEPQDRLGKDRLGKDSVGKDSVGKDSIDTSPKGEVKKGENPPIPLGEKKTEKQELKTILNSFAFSSTLHQKIQEWLLYKKERRKTYKPTGLHNLLVQVQNQCQRHGEKAVIEIINRSMANNYEGILWAKIAEEGQTRTQSAQNLAKQNRFCNYEQRNWDFAELERMERERLQGTDMG